MGSPDYPALREEVLVAARQGRATYLPAGARGNATAQIYIDGVLVGQASTVGHYVREAPDASASRFAEIALVPGFDHQIPERLR